MYGDPNRHAYSKIGLTYATKTRAMKTGLREANVRKIQVQADNWLVE